MSQIAVPHCWLRVHDKEFVPESSVGLGRAFLCMILVHFLSFFLCFVFSLYFFLCRLAKRHRSVLECILGVLARETKKHGNPNPISTENLAKAMTAPMTFVFPCAAAT
jgi:hypothetical protein